MDDKEMKGKHKKNLDQTSTYFLQYGSIDQSNDFFLFSFFFFREIKERGGPSVPVPARDEQVVESLVPEESPRKEGAGRDRRVQRGVPVGHGLTIVFGLH